MTATYPGDRVPSPAGGHPLVRVALAVEQAKALDAPAALLARVARAVVADPARRAALQGRWLGHSAHPVVVAVPLGTWTAVSFLDVLPGTWSREAARTLTGFGIAMAVPSALTGLAEYDGTRGRDRRTATVHALANSTGLVWYVASWRARRRGQHVRGALLGTVGYAAVNVGGFLGGHLTQARKVGSHHPAFADNAPGSAASGPRVP